MQQFFWQGEDNSYINILLQKNINMIFEQIPYPVTKPYILYTSGDGERAKERLQWATFFGQIGSEWIMGTGAYYYVSKNERIIVVITNPLEQPAGSPPKNTTLTRNQYLQIDQFSNQWQSWLNKQFEQGPGSLKQLIRSLKLGEE